MNKIKTNFMEILFIYTPKNFQFTKINNKER